MRTANITDRLPTTVCFGCLLVACAATPDSTVDMSAPDAVLDMSVADAAADAMDGPGSVSLDWSSITATCLDESGWMVTLVFGVGSSSACTWDALNGPQVIVRLPLAELSTDVPTEFKIDSSNSVAIFDREYGDAVTGILTIRVDPVDPFDEELPMLPHVAHAEGNLSVSIDVDGQVSTLSGHFEAVLCPPWAGQFIMDDVCRTYPASPWVD